MATIRNTTPGTARTSNRWRTIDIIVASVIGVAFGVVFWAWGLLWNGPADAIPLPGRALLYGVWLVPAVLGGVLIRKPGAAFYCEVVATIVSVTLGSAWGLNLALLQGPIEAAAGELAFALFAYRNFRLPVALLAAAFAGFAASLYDKLYWYPDYSWGSFGVPYILLTILSTVIIAGFGSVLLVRQLAQTGVLDRFPSGRERQLV